MFVCWRQTGKAVTDWCVFAVKTENELNAQTSSAHTAFDRRLWWQACLSCVHAAFRHSLLHYSLRSFEKNMSSQDISQSAHIPCCRRLFTLFAWAFLYLTDSPFFPTSTPSLPLLSFPLTLLSLHIRAGVHTYTWYNISWWVSNEKWMLNDLTFVRSGIIFFQ